MKNTLLIALVVLKLPVSGVPSASTETRLEQLSESNTVEKIHDNGSRQPVKKTSTQVLDASQQQPSFLRETTSEKTQLLNAIA
ncbi:MAG TPA: hypothetical protein IGS53_25265 [Leptolyngbyaceae cyanobacterium M33_DOE_097]|uniref:Uncharacterized protein n=1 Tax=Oscillatoriales cyanobacterium SpSt-418 TaxID=2282169 RepID=A0A7C3PJV9_9CYAN|nr:hypothetical protein [Leptolyngbyaceae cyanobacterium M33_DOE_097]